MQDGGNEVNSLEKGALNMAVQGPALITESPGVYRMSEGFVSLGFVCV